MDISEIQDLIKFIAKAGVTEVEIEKKDFKITIKSEMPKKKGAAGAAEATIQMPVPVAAMPQAPAPAAAPAPAPAAAPEAPKANADEDNYITVKSPMIGTFYRRSAPDKPTFVEVGSTVGNGDVLCVIEAMKLFNEIESEVSGKIVKILVDDNSPVEYDQPLFLVDPS
ncbi:MAG: acetyl-CoA carboxylase biotin carboxyl carrier protein [Crocinitomicaceae bacterium TMED209]|nr:MAG: acetyl-CoA carboxylase biotin carboxyl carrier protein [Crocinitomicaceae bacterium TMED209]|tara:strand:- start:6857 stop:7360 length:504 start_codon:yes stop_codon:yes gene_type:complete